MSRLPGLDRLWALTKGRPEVRIAVLDGPADVASVAGTLSMASGVVEHGTHVQSIIAGSSDLVVPGLAPGCTVFSIPIFEFRCRTRSRLAPRPSWRRESAAHSIAAPTSSTSALRSRPIPSSCRTS